MSEDISSPAASVVSAPSNVGVQREKLSADRQAEAERYERAILIEEAKATAAAAIAEGKAKADNSQLWFARAAWAAGGAGIGFLLSLAFRRRA